MFKVAHLKSGLTKSGVAQRAVQSNAPIGSNRGKQQEPPLDAYVQIIQ